MVGYERAEARTILVAGGAGFLGSHLCEALLEEGARVICLDSFQTGRRANIEHL
jgi:nucleoside-diphosphate-sugar epimerase